MTKQITEVGLTEKITVIGQWNRKEVVAKFDTGASKSSIDEELAINIGAVLYNKTKVRSAFGAQKRFVVKVTFVIKGKKFKNFRATISDRSEMKHKVLIGRNILKDNFSVNVSK